MTMTARPLTALARAGAMALALALGPALAIGPAQAQNAAPPTFAPLVKRLLPTVVNISTTQELPSSGQQMMPDIPEPFRDLFRDFQGPATPRPPREVNALGSGFIIDPAGYIVTNNHVVEGASRIVVILHDNAEFPAELVGTDPRTDIALLKIDAGRDLPTASWGDSDVLEVGDWVMAIGNPFGLGGTVTTGILSARARDIQPGPFDDFLQTDAAINRGNSGGPMFNMAGEVVGVNTAIFSPTGGSVGIGFAVPSAIAEPVVAELRESGTVRRGWLGVGIQPLSPEIREGLGIDAEQGALVAEVEEGSPAAQAGIEVGDLIIGFNGDEIEDPLDLSRSVAQTDPETQATVTVLRDGQRTDLNVTLGVLRDQVASAAPDAGRTPPERGETVIGMQLAPLDEGLREQLGVEPGTSGAVVVGIQPDSPAAEQGFAPGDVILRVGRTTVTGPDDVRRSIEQARQANQNSVLVLRQREGRQLFVPVPLS